MISRCGALASERPKNTFSVKDLETDLGRLLKGGNIEQHRDVLERPLAASALAGDRSLHGCHLPIVENLKAIMHVLKWPLAASALAGDRSLHDCHLPVFESNRAAHYSLFSMSGGKEAVGRSQTACSNQKPCHSRLFLHMGLWADDLGITSFVEWSSSKGRSVVSCRASNMSKAACVL